MSPTTDRYSSSHLRRHLPVIAGIFAITFALPFARWQFLWRRADATIVDAAAVPAPGRDEAPGATTRAAALVAYEYAFEGHRYTGGRLAETFYATDIESAQTTVSRYIPGRHVLAFVDPANPAHSFLERHVGQRQAVNAFVLSLLYILFIILLPTNTRSRPPGR